MPTIKYPKNPNSETAFVEQDDGTKNRALMIAPQDISNLELPKNANSCKGYVIVNGKKQRVVLTADITGGSSLPDQTGQSGKFLTTDGTDASWSDKPLQNTATGTDALSVLGSASSSYGATNIGVSSQASASYALAVGYNTKCAGGVAIGYNSKTMTNGIAIGYEVQNTGDMFSGSNAISFGRTITNPKSGNLLMGQFLKGGSDKSILIGFGVNSGTLAENTEQNTFAVALPNNGAATVYKMLDNTGIMPADRLASTTGLADGNYKLRLTMASGVPTLSWVAE